MTGHGEKLTRKQEQAIVALIEEPTIGTAAKRIGVSESTLGRWQQDMEFKTAFNEARSLLVTRALEGLGQAGRQAVTTLIRNMNCGTPSIEVKAAAETLRWMIEATEIIDMRDRIGALEMHGRKGY